MAGSPGPCGSSIRATHRRRDVLSVRRQPARSRSRHHRHAAGDGAGSRRRTRSERHAGRRRHHGGRGTGAASGDAGRGATELLRIQGPNCLGLMLPASGSMRASATACRRREIWRSSRSRARSSPPSSIGRPRGIGFSHVVSLGDMADADFGDFLDYLAGDPKSRAILLYMEQLTQAPKFMSAARRAARAKPVIVLKSGRHATARGPRCRTPARWPGRTRRTTRRSVAPDCCA